MIKVKEIEQKLRDRCKFFKKKKKKNTEFVELSLKLTHGTRRCTGMCQVYTTTTNIVPGNDPKKCEFCQKLVTEIVSQRESNVGIHSQKPANTNVVEVIKNVYIIIKIQSLSLQCICYLNQNVDTVSDLPN